MVKMMIAKPDWACEKHIHNIRQTLESLNGVTIVSEDYDEFVVTAMSEAMSVLRHMVACGYLELRSDISCRVCNEDLSEPIIETIDERHGINI